MEVQDKERLKVLSQIKEPKQELLVQDYKPTSIKSTSEVEKIEKKRRKLDRLNGKLMISSLFLIFYSFYEGLLPFLNIIRGKIGLEELVITVGFIITISLGVWVKVKDEDYEKELNNELEKVDKEIIK